MKKTLLSLLIGTLSVSSFALTKQEFIKKLPEHLKSQVKEVGPIGDGLFYVKTENSYYITSKTGEYLIPKGMTTVVKTKDNSNATAFLQEPILASLKAKAEQMQAAEKAAFKKAFEQNKEMLKEIAVKEVKGNGARTLYVFTDPKCPFCRKLDVEILPQLTNVTIYHIMRPIVEIRGHEKAAEIGANILCSANPVDALHANFSKGDSAVKVCEDTKRTAIMKKIENAKSVFEELGVNGTPTMADDEGNKLIGAVPLAQIESFLTKK